MECERRVYAHYFPKAQYDWTTNERDNIVVTATDPKLHDEFNIGPGGCFEFELGSVVSIKEVTGLEYHSPRDNASSRLVRGVSYTNLADSDRLFKVLSTTRHEDFITFTKNAVWMPPAVLRREQPGYNDDDPGDWWT